LDNNGIYYCPLCYSQLSVEVVVEDDLFDDDEDDIEAFDSAGEIFVAEGISVQNQTPEEKKVIDRLQAIEEINFTLELLDVKLASFMAVNSYEIVSRLRTLEYAGEPAFAKEGESLAPKILAVAAHMANRGIDDATLRKLNVRTSTYNNKLRVLRILYSNKGQSVISEKIRYVGNAINLSKGIIDVIVEQYEENPLPNSEPDPSTRGAAFIYIKARQAGIKVTKTSLKNVPGVMKNALDRAIKSYEGVIRKGNNRDEDEVEIDEPNLE
jgi:hypothetical protein